MLQITSNVTSSSSVIRTQTGSSERRFWHACVYIRETKAKPHLRQFSIGYLWEKSLSLFNDAVLLLHLQLHFLCLPPLFFFSYTLHGWLLSSRLPSYRRRWEE